MASSTKRPSVAIAPASPGSQVSARPVSQRIFGSSCSAASRRLATDGGTAGRRSGAGSGAGTVPSSATQAFQKGVKTRYGSPAPFRMVQGSNSMWPLQDAASIARAASASFTALSRATRAGSYSRFQYTAVAPD